MFKNVAAKFIVFAFDTTTGVAKTGDAANITAYVSKDYGTATVLGDTSATEMDATNAKGYYLFDAAQAETNADCLMVSGKSTTSNISVIGAPAVIYTRPTTGWLAPATAGRTLVVDAAGLADANVVKVGPTGSGTAQTARDIGASVLLSTGTGTGQLDFTSGVVKANAVQWLGGTIPAVNVTGVPLVDLKYTLGTISPAAAGSVRADAGDPLAVALPGGYSAGTMGYLIGTNLNATVSSRLASASYTAPLSAGATENAVWDAVSASHVTAGTTGKKLADASAAGTPPTVVEIADEVQTRTIAAVTTVTNLTNAPTSGDLTATMKSSVTTAASSSTPALSTAGNAAVADKMLGRNLAGGSDGTRMVKDALRSLRNKTSIAGGTLTVTQEDDSTPAWTATVTTAAGDPLTSIDPA